MSTAASVVGVGDITWLSFSHREFYAFLRHGARDYLLGQKTYDDTKEVKSTDMVPNCPFLNELVPYSEFMHKKVTY